MSKFLPRMSLIFNIALPNFVGFVSSIFTMPSIQTWYVLLNKPSFNPLNWIFSPVWTILYTLMGIAFYLFYKKDKFQNKKVYVFYAFHLLINGSGLFFFFFFIKFYSP